MILKMRHAIEIEHVIRKSTLFISEPSYNAVSFPFQQVPSITILNSNVGT